MPSSGLGAYQVKIHQIVFGGLFFLIVLMGVRAMMAGGAGSLQLLAVVSLLVGILLALDKYYWLLTPCFFISGLRIPSLPFSATEIACFLFIGTFFVRAALHRDQTNPFSRKTIYSMPFFSWICIIWVSNPTGLAMFGSGSIGARNYIALVLGFVTMVMSSKLIIKEKEARYLFFSVLCVNVASLILSFQGFMELDDPENSLKYFLSPALPIFLLLLCRYRVGEIFSVIWRLFIVMILAAVVAYSGKRKTMGAVLLAPFVLMILRRRDYLSTMICATVGVLFLGFVVAGHGSLYELPYSAQRALSFLPGQWDERLEEFGMTDIFRDEMKRQAVEKIRASPWVGRKGFNIDRDVTSWIIFSHSSDMYTGHEYVGNWHNVWLGMAADFGLPALILGVLFSVSILINVFNMTRGLNGGYLEACSLYFALNIVIAIVFAHVSGSTAGTPAYLWVHYGFFIALVNANKIANKLTFQTVSTDYSQGKAVE